MKAKWPIQQLQIATEIALTETEYDGAPSARIQSVPDLRAIRYYTTLGLLDRPTEMRGRTAFYGRRHVLQLVVIKQMQSEGLSLGEIQQKLTGASDRRLSSLAKLPATFWDNIENRVAKKAKQSNKSSEKKSVQRSAEDSWRLVPRHERSFWAEPVQAANQSPKDDIVIRNETRIEFPGGVAISIPLTHQEVTPEIIEQLSVSIQPFLAVIESARLDRQAE